MIRPLIAWGVLALVTTATRASTPEQVVDIVTADIKRVSPDDYEFVRYQWIPRAGKALGTFKQALLLHVNLISREAEFGTPTYIADDVVRVDIREYRWGRQTYDKLAEQDRIFHAVAEIEKEVEVEVEIGHWSRNGQRITRDGKTIAQMEASGATWNKTGTRKETQKKKVKEVTVLAPWLLSEPERAGLVSGKMRQEDTRIGYLAKIMHSRAPIVSAATFFRTSARQLTITNEESGFGYYDALELKKRADWFNLVGYDEKKAKAVLRQMRAVMDVSEVSSQNRQIIIEGAVGSWVFGTLDVKTEKGDGIAVENLRPGEFRHDAEEWYGRLPNGLPATLASDNNGVLQSSVPDFVGPDDSDLRRGRDGRIHPNLCLRCHTNVLKPIDDWVRRTYQLRTVNLFGHKVLIGEQLQSPDKAIYLELRRLYFSDLNWVLQRETEEYARAYKRLLNLTPVEANTLYAQEWNYEVELGVTRAQAALELGLSEGEMVRAFKAYQAASGSFDLTLTPWLNSDKSKIPRAIWEDKYASAQLIVKGLVKAK